MKTTYLNLTALSLGLLFSSCIIQQQVQEPPAPTSTEELQATFPLNSYQHFVAHFDYPTTMLCFMDEGLLKKASPKNPIYICLDQQRGRLYIDNQVAMDWPVSTGVNGRRTPTGNFKVLSKKASYSSNMYGKMYDAEGKLTDYDANAYDEVPEGGKFVGAPMPYWQRLTNDGIGMHTGKVRAGRRLSHGCIRTPNTVAARLYKLTQAGVTPVYVVQGTEKAYEVQDILDQKKDLPKTAPTESKKS